MTDSGLSEVGKMGNKKRNMTFPEFSNIAMAMKEVPKKGNENQRDYFARLNERYLKIERSRYVLQKVVYSLEKEPEDLKKAYEIYKKDGNESSQTDQKENTGDTDRGQYRWVQELGLLRRHNELLQEQNEILKLVSEKMAFIVEQLS